MTQFHWYSDTPTVMSCDGVVTFIFPTPEMKAALKKDAADWVAKAEKDGAPITVVTRAAVAVMLKDVDAKLVTDAGLRAETLDIAEPKSGSAEAKERAVQEKLSAVLPVAEFEKLEKLRASVVRAEDDVA